jgi:hypothetical protein
MSRAGNTNPGRNRIENRFPQPIPLFKFDIELRLRSFASLRMTACPCLLGSRGFGQLAAELLGIYTVLCGFSITDEDYRDVAAELFGEANVGVDVDFAKRGAEFGEEWHEDGFGVVAEVAAGASVESDDNRSGLGHAMRWNWTEVKSLKQKVQELDGSVTARGALVANEMLRG